MLCRNSKVKSWITYLVAAGAVVLVGRPVRAQDPIQPNTELGITVTPDAIFDSFEDSMTFWPAVRRHLLSPKFQVADLSERSEAEAYIRTVQRALHDRLMGADQVKAMDTVDFVRWNLRRVKFFRELHRTVANSDAMPELRKSWYRMFRAEMAAGRTPDPDALLAGMDLELKALALPAEREAQVKVLWKSIGVSMIAMEATETGRVLRDAEAALDGQASKELVRRVVSAADWASIIASGSPTCNDFTAAWEELNRPPLTQTASVDHPLPVVPLD